MGQIGLADCIPPLIQQARPLKPLDVIIHPLEMVAFLHDLKTKSCNLNPNLTDFLRNRDKGCDENSDLTCPSGLLSHLTNSRPKFPFFSSFEVNRFSGAVRGQSVHRVIGTGPYTGHVERGADEEVDISPERKKQRNCLRGRRTRRWGKKQRNCSICSMSLSVRWRRGEGEAILTLCHIVFCSLNI